MAMHAEFTLRRRDPRGLAYLEKKANVCASGVQLGQALFASGELDRLRSQNAAVKDVVETLQGRLLAPNR
jgi:hypothetical protein